MIKDALSRLRVRPSQMCDLASRPAEGHVAWLVGHAWPKGGIEPVTGRLCFHAADAASALSAAHAASPACEITTCERAPHLDGVFWGHCT